MPEEIWKEVENFEGLYEVSSYGNVKALERYVFNNGGKQHRAEKILKPNIQRGYKMVVLCKDGKTYPRSIHRLVASAFIPNPENKPTVDHIDTNPSNNNVENLRWATQKENCNNPKSRINNSKSKMGHEYHRFEYTEEMREKMRQARLGKKASAETRKKLSDSHKGHKLSEETISKIVLAHKGIPRSEETKKKLRESNKGNFKNKHWKVEGGKRVWF